jgi:outer membrane protein assembly factor BamB
VLYAVNAETLEGLWNTQQNAKRDRLGTLVKFTPPVVAAGKVYIPNYDNAVNVYGLLPAAR